MVLPSVSQLTNRRKELRLSQRALAKIIHVHPGSISNWERGTYVSIHLRAVISYVLDAIESGRPIADSEIRDIVLKGVK